MPTPLKVSDALMAVARHEAKATNRSITAQVEYWARIGRAAEALFAHEEVLTLKNAGELLTPVFPSAVRRREVHDVLAQLVASGDREASKAAIRSPGVPRYSRDAARPGQLIQTMPDGTKRSGHLEGRRFIPTDADPRSTRG